MTDGNKNRGILTASDMLGRAGPGRDALDPNSAIAQKLKALYTQTEQESIPDRFLDLLEQLDEAERAANASGKG